MALARRSNFSIFRWPLLVAVASGFGLVAALVADGTWDVLAALALLVPTGLTCWFLFRSRRSRAAGSG